MITKILMLIFSLINFIISKIIQLVLLAFPDFGLGNILGCITSFFDILKGAFNMTYFLFGETTYIFADIIITLFTVKHIALPVVNFIRKFVVKD